jgi:hypothetical protein
MNRPKVHLVTRDLYDLPRDQAACGRPIYYSDPITGHQFCLRTTETVADVTCLTCKRFTGSTHERYR